MKKCLIVSTVLLSLLFIVSTTSMTQTNSNAKNANSTASNSNSKRKRGPVFRADKNQVKQAQAILKQRGFYAGDQTGKLDAATRDGLKKYQAAEGLKVTGTLNKVTLEKMNITLTDKQKTM
ncbi:MAG TPA: peptidoglycan-binding domain-containing protein [Pyrinomonadaceae bacterium]|nr:peptidoglycan-binding domain-containing protein [Pyrinomonadaceae bacterium]